jgi:hypothetical protein
MLATVHIADLGVPQALRTTARRPPRRVPGLRWGSTALAMPLASSGAPPLGRAGLFAFWEDERSAEAFFADDPRGVRFQEGLRATLRPLRAHGSWPGLPDEVPRGRKVAHDGPVAVLTMSWLRLSQLGRFGRASKPAEEAALADEGMRWGTTALRLPFAATFSIWSDTRSVMAYAYSRRRPEHPQALDEGERKSFNKRATFVRLAPVRIEGSLVGRNPFDAAALPMAAVAPEWPAAAS